MVEARQLSDEELRAKWSRPREEIEADLKRNPPQPNKALAAANELPSMRICPDCQAHGVRKVQYGFRVMDEVCERCGGEGVLAPPKPEPELDDDGAEPEPPPLDDEAAAKVAQVEALVAKATSLDELERLEAALRSGNLDSVLGVVV